jgi:hypothetical protein
MKTFAVTRKPGSHTGPRQSVDLAGRPAQLQRARIRHILRSARAQAKLAVAAPDDVYEQEAARVAEAVMSMSAPQARDQTLANTSPPGEPPALAPRLQPDIDALRSGGRPLPPSTRAFFEPRFGRDFSSVRLHTDAPAADTAKAVRARAYTVGPRIVFGAGEYKPATTEGRRLIAHELAHAAQQGFAPRPARSFRRMDIERSAQPDGSHQSRAITSDRGLVVQRVPSAAAIPQTSPYIAKPGDSLSLIAGYPEEGWRDRLDQLIAANADHPNIKGRSPDDPRYGWLEIGDAIVIPWAQSSPVLGDLVVEVIFPHTFEPIADAEVDLSFGAAHFKATTTASGQARFSGIPVARYVVRVAHPEFETAWSRGTPGPAPGTTVFVEPVPTEFDVVKIPVIMRALGWTVAPRTQDIWLNGPANANPEAGAPVTNLVTMSWVRGFAGPNALFNRLIADRVWVNEAAQAEIASWLRTNGYLGPTTTSFGNFQRPVPDIDADYVQRRDYTVSVTDPIDELIATLANFNYRMAVKGTATPLAGGRHRVHIAEVGIYVRDSFDFIDEGQRLGCWNEASNRVMLGPPCVPESGYVGVWNETYREWRDRHGQGGDYIIYSDLHIHPTDDQFTIP